MAQDGKRIGGKDAVIEAALRPAAGDFGQEVKPLGKEVGEVTVRAVRVGLRGVSAVVWGFDKIADFVERSVAEKLKDVAPEKIADADPRIAVPAVEALRYSAGDADIREMFASLIATDLNSDTKAHTHPSFVEMIKQMSVEDAKVLRAISADKGRAILFQAHLYLKEDRQRYHDKDILLTCNVPGVDLPAAIKAVYSLVRLGLLRVSETSHPAGKFLDKIEKYKETKDFQKLQKAVEAADHIDRMSDHKIGIWLTPLGNDFVAACL